MNRTLPTLLALAAAPALADETRELDAHEHGVGELNIAFDGATVAMELHAPGADIVGFEHAAESNDDRAAIDAAVAILAKPLDLFLLPAAAECSVTKASAGLESAFDHDDHEDHAEAEDLHDHEEEHAHDDHHDDGTHSEFHAEYELTCGNPGALSGIDFAYFNTFENALELDVQIVTASGAQAFEVERDAPSLDLRGMF